MSSRVIQGFFLAGGGHPPRTSSAPRPSVAQARGAGSAFAVDPGQLGLAQGGGRPLPDSVRGSMEAALGADFSAVRVHVGPQPERIGAVAFTLGSDIYFAPGRFQPETAQGRQLLGHELAHVVQQRAGRVRNPLGGGIAVVRDFGLEAEADRLGRHAAIQRATARPRPAPPRDADRRSALSARVAPPGGATIQHALRFGGSFNAWFANSYTRGWDNFRAAADRENGDMRQFARSQRTHLRVETEHNPPRNRLGNTKLWVRRHGLWYDCDVHDINTWSRANSDSQVEIVIKIRDNLTNAEILQTLTHEWAAHGKPFLDFINNTFRNENNTDADIRRVWNALNQRGHALDVREQHAQIGERRNPYLRRIIYNLIGMLPRVDGDALYRDYLADVHDH